MTLKIGNVELENNVILAPMAGVTDMPYRILCREQGAGLVCMEMVSAKAILYKNKNTQELLKVDERERPVSLQLFGSDPDIVADIAAKGNPWIFKQITHYLETGELLPRPSVEELKAMILRHGQMMMEFKGELAGMREMRKHVAWYTAGYPNSAALRNEINSVATLEELTELIGTRL